MQESCKILQIDPSKNSHSAFFQKNPGKILGWIAEIIHGRFDCNLEEILGTMSRGQMKDIVKNES